LELLLLRGVAVAAAVQVLAAVAVVAVVVEQNCLSPGEWVIAAFLVALALSAVPGEVALVVLAVGRTRSFVLVVVVVVVLAD
jgi:hypothetical protein